MKKIKNISKQFPSIRMRRNRMKSFSRRLIAENKISIDDLIWPLFVIEGTNVKAEVLSMPGVARLSVDNLLKEVETACKLKIPAVAIFPHIEGNFKDDRGTLALDPDNLVCRAIKKIKKEFPDIGIICDVALDPYTDHGHDGIVADGQVDNDQTLLLLGKQAVIQASAGCDIIAPSDMMDGRVGFIRKALDDAGFINVQIMSYAAKYASCFYSPFRDAVGSTGNLAGASKSTYQMDPANSDESLREVELDISEGADMIMIKPGMPYLDIISRIKKQFQMPTFAFQVSGEYSMIMAACQNNWLDKDKVIHESLLCFKRAGADGILTYFAKEIAKLLTIK